MRVPPGNMSYSRSYMTVDRSALKYLDHQVGIDDLSEVWHCCMEPVLQRGEIYLV